MSDTASIINDKYKGKYKGASDWIGELVKEVASVQEMKTVKAEDGTESEIPKGRPKLDLDKLFALCKENHIDYSEMEKQRDRPNAPGRIRMTLGNMLRAAARKRHGLYVSGEWRRVPDGFVDEESMPTETRGGEKIAKLKPETADEAA